ncbi:MAG TPA: exonuclease domain-containing protein [Micromonosporaceae bacterium]|nr:exonuclease domain-containing protein [Micromonosporaceae bacterium]
MTAPWMPARCLAFDLETTGTDVAGDRIVSACAAIVENGEVKYRKEWLIAVDVDIPAEATAVHGITTEHAREHGMPAEQGVREIAGAIRYALGAGTAVVGFNVAFDLSMLDAECARNGLGSLTTFCGGDIWPVLDGFVLDKATDRYRPGSRKLADVAKNYDVELVDAHDAAADALAAVDVVRRIAERSVMSDADLRQLYADRKYPDSLARTWRALGRMSLAEVHTAQVGWFAEQAESLAVHWRGKAAEMQDQAGESEPPGDEALSADERAQVLRDDAAELIKRADGITGDWPLNVTTTKGKAIAA